ncbi:MAG: sensor histidine kinase [Eubacterium sp.]|nr:sensor histidine kinase [Eubacterium sp.]
MPGKKHIFNKIKVQKQLYLIYLIAIFVPVTIIGGYLVYSSRSLLLDHYKELAYADNLRVKSLLLDITSDIYNRSQTLANSGALVKFLSTDYRMEPERSTNILTETNLAELLSQDVSIHQIVIYTFNDTIPESAHIRHITDDIRKQGWFARASGSVAPFWSKTVVSDDFGNEMESLCLYSHIFLPRQNSYAILNMTLSNNHIKNRIEGNSLYTVIWLKDDGIFYRSSRNAPQYDLITSYAPGANASYTGTVDLEEKMIGSVSPLLASYSRDLFYIASVNDSGYAYIRKITRTYLAILLLILIATSIFISLFSNYFSSRVIALREAMHNASLGNYHVIDAYSGEDEISDAFADLNIMIQDILHKEASIYEAQIRAQLLENQQQRMEFKMLASQINPHFLYNTLETIRMRSIKAGCLEVANGIKLLGKSMRYVLQNTATSFTTLEKELDYIQTYLAIQKLRFHDRVNYSLKIRTQIELDEYSIFPLLLQPVVENAILHGLEDVEENGRIIIHILTRGDKLHIVIFDNGCGMTLEQIDRMQQNMRHHPEESSKSIGLYNIYHRIQLYYGSAYGIHIQSRMRLGTAVTLVLPAPGTDP